MISIFFVLGFGMDAPMVRSYRGARTTRAAENRGSGLSAPAAAAPQSRDSVARMNHPFEPDSRLRSELERLLAAAGVPGAAIAVTTSQGRRRSIHFGFAS